MDKRQHPDKESVELVFQGYTDYLTRQFENISKLLSHSNTTGPNQSLPVIITKESLHISIHLKVEAENVIEPKYV